MARNEKTFAPGNDIGADTRFGAEGGPKPSPFPTAYDPAMDDQAREMAAKGVRFVDMAAVLGVNVRTVSMWRDPKDPNYRESFALAVIEGRAVASESVEDSLLNLALEAENESARLAAARFWLVNRKPEQWRDKQDIVIDDLRKLSDAEFREALAAEVAAFVGGSKTPGPDAPTGGI